MRRLLTTYRKAFSGLPRDVWLIALAAFVNRAGTMVTVFLPLWLVREHNFNESDAITFMALFGAGAVVGTLIGGWLTDHFRPLPVQVGALTGVAAAFLALANTTSPAALGTLTLTIGLLGQAFRPANDTLLATVSAPDQRARAYGLHRIAINLGWTIGPVAGGLLSELSWTLLFWSDAATCLVAAAILHQSFRGRRTTPQPPTTTNPKLPTTPLQDPHFLALAFCTLLVSLVFVQFFSTLTVYLGEGLGWSPARVGAMQSINPVLIVLFEMLLVQRYTHANPLRVVAFGALLIGAGFGLLAASPGTAWIVVCIAVLTFGEMLHYPFATSYTANRASDQTRGRYLAIYGLAFSLAMVAGPVIGGAVRARYGWAALWIGAGGVGVLGALAFARLAHAVARERDQ